MDWQLLRRVARSFFITIRCLPGEVRESIALGYLLARASDSIADTSEADIERRLAALHELRRGDIGQRILAEMVKFQPRPAEAELLAALPNLLDQLDQSRDREALEDVWEKILRGQIFDLVRFIEDEQPLSLDELDEYTYLVAGCVGEFWTELCFERLLRFSDRDRPEQVDLGIRYGKGLQMVNVLRDRQSDELLGRRYVPPGHFNSCMASATSGMKAGLKWAEGVTHPAMRYACILPARIGLATLNLLQPDSGPVKIPRSHVRRIVLESLPSLFLRSAG